MKISLNSVKGFNERYKCCGDIAPDGVDDLVRRIGAQLGEIESVTDFGSKYKGVVLAKVVSCVDHPDADRLHVCTIDDGGITPDVKRNDKGHVEVVCGAPNVREGLVVAWLPPGSTVPESASKEPFVLEARELRGVVSNGMLASPKELAIGDSHDGILELDTDAAPGTPFAEAYGLDGDVIIDIENKMFTHRPDCFGMLGIDRELAGIQGIAFKSPDWYRSDVSIPSGEGNLALTVHNELPELVPRFTAIAMQGVNVGVSPVWLQIELAKAGIRSINNIVDYTNFFMLETGQPLHAYDYDKVKALSNGDSANLVVRNPRENEKITLLNGKTVDPRQEAIMIATDKQLIGIGGVMGGGETEVDSSTKNIILEAATFDMYSIRRTSMAHGLFTDAVARFNKGQSPLQNVAVLAKIVDEIARYAGGKVASVLVDDNHVEGREWVHPPVPVTAGFINDRLGLKLSADEMKTLLENVEFKIDVDGDKLTVSAPFWRTDIEQREDVVEEVGRLYGYDKLPLELPVRSIKPVDKDTLFTAKSEIRSRLSKAGANEVLTYSFVHANLLEKTGQDAAKAFRIGNALSPDLQYYRLSLMPSLLEKVHPNVKAGYDQFALFEIGKVHDTDHLDEDGIPAEFEYTGLVVTAGTKSKPAGAAYYQAKAYLEALCGDILEFKPLEGADFPVTQPYAAERSALVSIKGGQFLGVIGEFKPTVTRALKLPEWTAGFEVHTTVLQPILAAGTSYAPLSRYPSVRQDITLKVPADVSYADTYSFVDKELGANAPADTHIALSPIAVYQKEDASKQYTFRIGVTAQDRTLTDKEVSAVLDAIAVAAASGLKAERL